MGKLINILPISDLRQDAAKVMKKLRDSKEPIIITQRGRAAAVIIGVEAYEKSEHDKEILRLLAKGDKEIEMGEGYDLDTVLAEADLILSQEPSRKSASRLLLEPNFCLRSHIFGGTNFLQQPIFESVLKPFCEGSRTFLSLEESYQYFQNFPTGR